MYFFVFMYDALLLDCRNKQLKPKYFCFLQIFMNYFSNDADGQFVNSGVNYYFGSFVFNCFS